MKIPTRFKIGRRVFTVHQPRKLLDPPAFGRAMLISKEIHVAQEYPRSKFPRKDKDRFHTFWHEVMHAILHDMGSTSYKDEVFVDQLAKRIAGVIHTVEF